MAPLAVGQIYAAEMADVGAGLDTPGVRTIESDNTGAAAACHKQYIEGDCGRFQGNPNYIDCSRPETAAPGKLAISCVKGAATGVWDTAAGLVKLPYDLAKGLAKAPGAIAKVADEESKCYADIRYKAQLLEPLKTQLPAGASESMAERWTCSEIRRHVEQASQRINREISLKKLNQERYDAFIKANPGQEKSANFQYPESQRKLDEKQESFIKDGQYRDQAISNMEKMLKELKENMKCATNQHVAKTFCKVAAEVGLAIATPAALVKGVQLARAAAASEYATAVRAAVRPASLAERTPAVAERVPPAALERPPATLDRPVAERPVVERPPTERPPVPDEVSASERRSLTPTPAAERLAIAEQDAARVSRAEAALGRGLTEPEATALNRAHRVGEGELGRSGAPAGVGDYTTAQLRQKSEILRDAGFPAAERRQLVEAGLVGREPAVVERIPIFAERPLLKVAADDAVALPRSSGGYTNGIVTKVENGTAEVRFRDVDGNLYSKPVPVRELRSPIAEGDRVAVARTSGGYTDARVAKVHDNGTAEVRFRNSAGQEVGKIVPTSELRAASELRAPTAARAPPPAPLTNEAFRATAKSQDDIRDFVRNAPDSEVGKFVKDFFPGKNHLSAEIQAGNFTSVRHFLQHPNMLTKVDQALIAPRAAAAARAARLGPPAGEIVPKGMGFRYVATDGSQVGYINYKVKTPGEVYVDTMGTHGQYAGRGVGDQLLQKVIERNPGATSYSAELAFENQRAVQAALSAGASCADAVRASPYYKSMRRLGFSNVISASCNGGNSYVTVGR